LLLGKFSCLAQHAPAAQYVPDDWLRTETRKCAT